MTNVSHSASFHSIEWIAPSNRGIKHLASFLHGETGILGEASHATSPTATFLGGISGEEEERELEELNDWVAAHGFTRGQMGWNYVDSATGAQKAILDLAWEDGVQRGLTEPVAVLLNESAELLSMANAAGFRCFTSSDAFRQYIRKLGAPNTEAFAAE